MIGDMSTLTLLIIGAIVILVGFLIISYLNQTVFFKKGPSSVSLSSTYEFRNKIKQPFPEQDI
jgi:hypothetical protein